MGRIRTIKPEIWTDLETSNGAKPYWIYCITEEGHETTGPCKVGIAADPDKRLSGLQCGNWRRLSFVWQIRLASRNEARETEQSCLGWLRPNPYDPNPDEQLMSEWVDATPVAVLAAAVRRLNVETQKIKRVA